MVTLKLNINPISEAQIEKRKELERKLLAEKEELETLEKSLAHINDATNKMTGMLGSFDSRLAKLESYIMPIHHATNSLSRTNKNLETSISLISAYTSVVATINYHASLVSKGLGQTTLESYLDSVKKLKDSLQQLESSKYKSSERITQDLRGRLSKGIQELDDLFSKTLINAGEACTESDVLDGRFTFGEKLKQLQTLAEVLSDSLEQIGPITGFLKIYSDERSAYLVKCFAQHNVAAKDQEVKMGYSRDVYQKGSSMLLPYAKALIGVLQTEYTCGAEVIAKHHLPTTFVNLVTAPIDGFLEICEALLNRVRKNLLKKESNDIYVLIDVVDNLSGIVLPYSSLLAHCGKKGHDIKTYIINSTSTILIYFKDLFEEFKPTDDATKKVPTLSLDGTVHEMTSTTMNTIKKIFEHIEPLITCLESSQSVGITFPSTSIKQYINQIMEYLIQDIDMKAKLYKKPVLAALFILNNVHYILKSIKGTGLTGTIESSMIENLEKIIKKQLDNYRMSWIPLIEHLMDNTKISENGKIVTQLSSKQKEAIKDRFKNFNKDFEEVFTTQKSYAIPDPELRSQVIKEVRQILCPMFDRFYDRYTTSLEFTKNVDKYIKWNKEELSVKLDALFDASS